jgi:hypothetical protein
MKRSLRASALSFCLIPALAAASLAQTSTWTGAAGTSWSSAGNWSPVGVPTGSTDVVIASTANQPSTFLFDPVCDDLTIDPGATMTLGSGFDLTVSGAVDIQGTLTVASATSAIEVVGSWTDTGSFNHGNGEVELSGSGALAGSGTTFSTLTVSGGTRTCSASFAADADVTVQSGASLDLGTLSHSVAGHWNSGAPGASVSGSGTLQFTADGLFTTLGNGVPNVLVSGGVRSVNESLIDGDLDMTGGQIQVLDNATLTVDGDLGLSGGTLGFTSSFAGLEVLDVAGSATITAADGSTSADTRIRVGGDWSSDSSFSPAAGLVELDGSGTNGLGGASPTFFDLTIVSGTRSVSSSTVVANDLTLDSGASISASAAFDVAGDVSLGNGSSSFALGAVTHEVSGDWISAGCAATGAGTVEFDADGTVATGGGSLANVLVSAGVRTADEVLITGNLDLTGGELRLADDTTLEVDGDATFAAGLLAFDDTTGGTEVLDVDGTLTGDVVVSPTSNNTRILAQGDWVSSATFAAISGFVQLSGGATTISGAGPTFPNLVIASGTKTATSAVDVISDLTILAGASLDSDAATSVAGSVSLGIGSAWDLGTDTHVLQGNYTSTGGDATGTGTIQFAAGGILSTGAAEVPNVLLTAGTLFVGDSVVSDTLTMTGGTLSVAEDQTLTVNGDLELTGGALTMPGFGGAPETLDVAGAATLTCVALNMAAESRIECGGDWSSSSAFSPLSGTVIIDSGTITTIAGGTPTVHHMEIVDGTRDIDSTLTVNGDLTLGASPGVITGLAADVLVGGDLDVSTASFLLSAGTRMTVQGDVESSGGTVLGAGTLEVASDGALASGGGSLGNLEISGGTRDVADTDLAGNLVLSGGTLSLDDDATLTVGGTADLQAAGVLALPAVADAVSDVIDIEGDVTASCTVTGGSADTVLRCNAGWTGGAAFELSAGLLDFDGVGPASIGGATLKASTVEISGGDYTFDTSAECTLLRASDSNTSVSVAGGSTLTLSDDLLLGDATTSLDLGGGTHDVSGDVTGTGGVATNGTLRLSGNGELRVSPGSVDHVTLLSGQRSVYDSALTGDLDLQDGALRMRDDQTLTVAGSALLTGGLLGFEDLGFGDETVDVSGDVTQTGTVAGAMGDFTQIICRGNWSSNSTFAPGGGVVSLIGAGPFTIGGASPTFAGLTIDGGLRTLLSAADVTADLRLQTNATLDADAAVSVGGDAILLSTATFDLGVDTHTVVGDWSTFAGTATGTGKVQFTGDGATVTEAGSISNVEVTGGQRTLGAVIVTGTLEQTGGDVTIDNGETVHVMGDASLTAGTLSFAAQAPSGADDELHVDGNLLVTATAGTFTSDSLIRCGGDYTCDAAFGMSDGRLVMDNAVASALSGSGSTVVLGDLTIENGGATSHPDALDLSGDLAILGGSDLVSGGSVDLEGDFVQTIAGSNWDLGTLTHAVSGNWTSLGGDATNGLIQLDGSGSLNTGAGTIDNLEVTAGVRMVAGAHIVNDLSMSGGTLRLNDNASVDVGGDLDLPSGLLAFDDGTAGLETLDVEGTANLTCLAGTMSADARLLVAGDWTSSSTWSPSAGLVHLDGVAQQVGGPSPTFHHLQLTGGPRAIASATAVSGDLSVDSGVALLTTEAVTVSGDVALGDGTASWDMGGQTHDVAGDWGTGGASATGAGRIAFTGDGETATGAASIAEVSVTGGARSVRTTEVTGLFTLDGGDLTLQDDQTLTIGGDAHMLSGTLGFTASVAGGEELIDVAGAAIVSAASGTHTANSVVRVAGDWSSDGSYAPAAGRVELTGAGSRMVSGLPPGMDPSFATLQVLTGTRLAGNDFQLGVSGMTIASGAEFDLDDRSVSVPAGVVTVDGILSIGSGGSLALGSGAAVNVSPIGRWNVTGSPSDPAVVTGDAGGGWFANVSGTLAASHFEFSEMGPTGMVVSSAATIAPFPDDLRGGVFRSPSALPASIMLDIQRAAPTEFRYVDFEDPLGVGSFNVRTFSGSTITLTNSGGDFSGPAFEQDPFSLVDWDDDATTVSVYFASAGLDQVTLNWTSSVETDITDWVLERGLSAAGPFSPLHEEAATGAGSYQHLDTTVLGGTTYHYRLSQRLSHGQEQELGNVFATPWSASLPPNMATVGPTGDFADVDSAVASLAGQFAPTVLIQPGTYGPFSVTTGIIGTLRIMGDGTGPVLIDTTTGPVQIFGISALESVELSDLAIGDPASPNSAVFISACTGAVIIDECTLDSGAGVAAANVLASTRVALQRTDLAGDPGLSMDGGSLGIAGKGSVDEIVLSNGSDLRTAEMGSPATTVDGTSTLEDLPGVHADIDLQETVPLDSIFNVTLSGEPNGNCAVIWSLGVSWLDFSGNLWEMVGMTDLGQGDILLVLPLGPAGSLTFPTSLPPDGILIGFPIVLQTVVINPSNNHRRWSNVTALIGTP